MGSVISLQGKTAIVTGASSGIGRGVAMELVRYGVNVVMLARRGDRLEEIVRELEKDSEASGVAVPMVVDVTDEKALVAAFDQTLERFSYLDILINAAGLGRAGSLMEGVTTEWIEVFNVNILALAVATREAIKRFAFDRPGHIIHLSSMSGHRVPRKGAFYAATKFAVRAMAEALRCELRDAGDPTRISCISPGFVSTEFFGNYFRGDQEKVDQLKESARRMLEVDDIVAAAMHVLTAPAHVEINDVLLRSNEQLS